MDRRNFLKGFAALFAVPVLPKIKFLQRLGIQTTDCASIARGRLWSAEMKRLLLAELDAMKFTDGDTDGKV